MSEYPQSIFGFLAMRSQSRWGSSSLLLKPPITVKIPRTAGSAKASWRSATREAIGDEVKSSISSTWSP